MANTIDSRQLEEALTLLNERLQLDGAERQSLVVCGGSSLIALGLVHRATRDVDVVARREAGVLVSSRPLPAVLKEAAARVAAELRLPPTWLNDGPADLFEMGLPEGFESRLERRPFGTHLELWFTGRFDQIHFKLYAAADRGPGRHVDDLLALHPTSDELLAAARWAFTHDVSEPFRETVRDMLRQLGHETVATQL